MLANGVATGNRQLATGNGNDKAKTAHPPNLSETRRLPSGYRRKVLSSPVASCRLPVPSCQAVRV